MIDGWMDGLDGLDGWMDRESDRTGQGSHFWHVNIRVLDAPPHIPSHTASIQPLLLHATTTPGRFSNTANCLESTINLLGTRNIAFTTRHRQIRCIRSPPSCCRCSTTKPVALPVLAALGSSRPGRLRRIFYYPSFATTSTTPACLYELWRRRKRRHSPHPFHAHGLSAGLRLIPERKTWRMRADVTPGI